MNAKKSLLGPVAVLALALGTLAVLGDVTPAQAGKRDRVKGPIASRDVPYVPIADGASRHVLWGDPEKREHGAFVRFANGADFGWHRHSEDCHMVVLEGAYLYEDEDGKRRVEAGSYFFIPGGKRHWSGGDREKGALFFNTFAGKFDLKRE